MKPAGANIDWNLNFAISLTAKSLNLNSAHYKIFLNFAMIAFIYGFQISMLSQVVAINSVYIFTLL